MAMITRDLSVIMISLDPTRDDEFDGKAARFSQDIHDLSRGLYRYNIKHRWDVSDTLFTNDQLLQEFGIVNLVESRKVDEVWVFGAETLETSMGGHHPFYLGGMMLPNTGYRRFPIMRIYDDPLYAFMGRVQHTLYQVYRGYPPAKNMWEKFIKSCGLSYKPPSGLLGNYEGGDGWLSDSDDWLNYPDLRGTVRWMTPADWNKTREGFTKWWLKRLPHGNKKTDGIHDNWWHYVMNLELVK